MLTGCCSVKKMNLTVEYASILCTTNGSCVAECYRGFIFSSGKTEQSYSCLNGVWSPVLSTCKRKIFPERQLIYLSYQRSRNRNDLLHVSYRTIWTNNNTKMQFNKRTYMYFSKVCVYKLSNAKYIIDASIQTKKWIYCFPSRYTCNLCHVFSNMENKQRRSIKLCQCIETTLIYSWNAWREVIICM